MTGSEKYMYGVILNIVGGLSLAGGIGLSVTVIGACLGLPMALLGLPLVIWGGVWAFQGYHEKQRETIAAGVQAGIQAAHASVSQPVILREQPVAARIPTPPPLPPASPPRLLPSSPSDEPETKALSAPDNESPEAPISEPAGPEIGSVDLGKGEESKSSE
jgi:hypothetical protein